MARLPPSRSKTRRVSQLLRNHDSQFGKLLRHASRLMQLEHSLAGLFDPELANRFQVAALEAHRLVLVTPAAPWATRLRMQAPQVVRALRDRGFEDIEQIDVRVAPLVKPPADARRRKPLSPAARHALDTMARLGTDSEDDDGRT